MDKRRNSRYAIRLNALVHPSVGRSWLCTIQDFCAGGMLLVEPDHGRIRKSAASINSGDSVGIHFTVPTGAKDKHFRLSGRIVRVMEGGIGINFPRGVDEDALTALLYYGNSAPVVSNVSSQTDMLRTTPKKCGVKAEAGATAKASRKTGRNAIGSDTQRNNRDLTGPIKEADRKRLIGAVRREVVRILPEINAAFFSYMDDELLILARDAKNNSEQAEYFAAMSNLEKAKKTVGQIFTNEVLNQIDNPRDLNSLLEERRKQEAERRAQEANRIKLSLVNTEEFEDWLAVANIISRSERLYEKFLSRIQNRLGMLVDSWLHNGANPIGTSVFCHSFDDAIRSVDLTKGIRQQVYSGFETKAIPLFRKMYISVIRLLEDSGLFPEYDEHYLSRKPVNVVAEEDSSNQEPELEPEPRAEDSPERGDDPEDESDLRREIRELREEVRGHRALESDHGSDPMGRFRRRVGKNSPPADVGEAISNIYSLMSVFGEETPCDDDEDFLGLSEVRNLLTAIRWGKSREKGDRQNVRQMLMGSAKARNRQLSPTVMENLEVVENLVDTIENDNLVSGSAKDWIRQLELTLGKVANENDNFLGDETLHTSLEVINQLARLGGSESSRVRRNIEEIVRNINQNYDSEPQVFEQAFEQLKPLVEKRSRSFTGNIQRTVKASEGQQTLVNAQRAVIGEISKRFAERDVPDVLLKLFMPGWRNLLVNTHLRQGQESTDWHRHIDVIEQLMAHLNGTADASSNAYLQPEELFERIEYGLDSISFDPGQRIPLVNSLREAIKDIGNSANLPAKNMSAETFAESLGYGDFSARDERLEEIRKSHESDPTWRKWWNRALNLHVGDWLEFSANHKDDRVSIVAWSNEDSSNFVFVNRRGVKTHDLSIEELVALLCSSDAKILEESDLPLSDRASHQMLQNMHNQLTHQATHVELTGLMNRKEFERTLEVLIADTQKNNSCHIVAYLDLDQFKVINNSAGHEAADQLLNHIGRTLVEQLEGHEFVVGRLGGDEFGVVLKDCAKEAGIAIIKQLCDAVKTSRYKWCGVVLTLTTSCGVVVVDRDLENVSAILRDADNACYMAKEAGRDRIHVLEVDDSGMEQRRDTMEFVAQIDRAIKEDRLVLNCQKIEPIPKDSTEPAHYEILLTVLDDDNEPMPPQDFILAAETYNRMGEIDRWVIKNSFRWIASNILKLHDLGAFSINISGSSLTEDDFMEFVLEQFDETRLPASKICFEITETSAIGSVDAAIEFMEKMKVIGVKFSLDDFGTGLSSYSYLRNLPVDYLKIDGIFVKDIKTNPSDYAVVKSINEIGHFMGKKTIAEYVEDDEILEILREIGVDFAQGYGIEKKMPINNLL